MPEYPAGVRAAKERRALSSATDYRMHRPSSPPSERANRTKHTCQSRRPVVDCRRSRHHRHTTARPPPDLTANVWARALAFGTPLGSQLSRRRSHPQRSAAIAISLPSFPISLSLLSPSFCRRILTKESSCHRRPSLSSPISPNRPLDQRPGEHRLHELESPGGAGGCSGPGASRQQQAASSKHASSGAKPDRVLVWHKTRRGVLMYLGGREVE